MGKRTKDKSEDEIKKKIRRLEKELMCRQKPSEENQQNEEPDNNIVEPECNQEDEVLDEDWVFDGSDSELQHEPEPEDESVPSGGSSTKSPAKEEEPKEPSVPSEILEILGEAKKSEESTGKKIPSEISERWGKILVEGLAKEQKESLLSKTLIPENFQLAKAPKLNPEVSSVLNEPARNRDKRLEKMQNQLGSGIAGLANLASELINRDLTKMEIIKNISEITQILLDLHYEESMNRRRLIIPILDKGFINIIQGVKREKHLFGDNLGENIKNTKSMERYGLQIKKASAQTSTPRRLATTSSGNFRAPPRQTSGAGTARAPLAPARYYPPPPPPPPPAARRPPPPSSRRPLPPPPGRPQNPRTRR